MDGGSSRADVSTSSHRFRALVPLNLRKSLNRKADESSRQRIHLASSISLPLSSPAAGGSDCSDRQKFLQMAEKLQMDLHYLESSLDKLQIVEGYLISQFVVIQQYFDGLHQILCLEPLPNASLARQIANQLHSLDQLVSHLKYQMPSLHFLPPRIVSRELDTLRAGGSNPYLLLSDDVKDVRGKIRNNKDFNGFMRDFQVAFDGLDERIKNCLLCFSVLPANAVVKKRLLKYWWIGEGLMERRDPCPLTADKVFEELMSKGFIEPVLKKRRVVGFQVNLMVRFVILSLAEERGFFAFNDMGMPMEKFSPSHRACLVGSDGNSERSLYSSSREDDSEPAKAVTIFNVNDSRPQLRKKWFSKLKGLKVLHLSGWPGSDNRLVEIDNPQFLNGLKDMKDLQLLSLQGITGIIELPDSISELTNLKILDLQLCHNLTKLPQNMHKLSSLTHLDISGCYWLDHIPKGVVRLKNLRVLKGFVIERSSHGDSCSFSDLVQLKELRKLNIKAGEESFPEKNDRKVLRSFQYLEKLTITWGNSSPKREDDEPHKPTGNDSSKEESDHSGNDWAQDVPLGGSQNNAGRLKKLEMLGFPGKALPSWTTKGKLMPRDKLNIRGGNLDELSGRFDHVKILSLKFLGELRMDWREMTTTFPKLLYLEKVRCPKLKFFPCDEYGVWINEGAEEKDLIGLGLPWSVIARAAHT